MAHSPPPVVLLALLCMAGLVAAQPPTILPPGILGVPEFVNPGFPVTAFVEASDPYGRLLTYSWELRNPKGKVVQKSEVSSFSNSFIIEGTTTLPPQHGNFKLTVTVAGPSLEMANSKKSLLKKKEFADMATASTTFKLTNLPPRKPVIKGFNTASDGSSTDGIKEVDGCGFVLALFASAGIEKRPLATVMDPEGDKSLNYIWQIFNLEGVAVITTPSRTNPIQLFHTGFGKHRNTIPPGTYTARVIVVDSPPAGYTAAWSTADSAPFTVQDCPNGYGPFGLNVPAVLGAVVSSLPTPSLKKILEPFTSLLPDFAKLFDKKHVKADGSYGGYYGSDGNYYGSYNDPSEQGSYDGGYSGSYYGGYYPGAADPKHAKFDKFGKLINFTKPDISLTKPELGMPNIALPSKPHLLGGKSVPEGAYGAGGYYGSYDGGYGSYAPAPTDPTTKPEGGLLSLLGLGSLGDLLSFTKPSKPSLSLPSFKGKKDPAGSYGDYGYGPTEGGYYSGYYGGDYGGYYGVADPNATAHGKFANFDFEKFNNLLSFSLPMLGLDGALDGFKLGNKLGSDAGASGVTINDVTGNFGLPEVGSLASLASSYPQTSNLRIAGTDTPVAAGGPFDSNIINTIIGAVLKDAFPQLNEVLSGPYASIGGPLIKLAGSALSQLGVDAYPALANLGASGTGSSLVETASLGDTTSLGGSTSSLGGSTSSLGGTASSLGGSTSSLSDGLTSGLGAGLVAALSGGLGDTVATLAGPAVTQLGEAALSAFEGAMSG